MLYDRRRLSEVQAQQGVTSRRERRQRAAMGMRTSLLQLQAALRTERKDESAAHPRRWQTTQDEIAGCIVRPLKDVFSHHFHDPHVRALYYGCACGQRAACGSCMGLWRDGEGENARVVAYQQARSPPRWTKRSKLCFMRVHVKHVGTWVPLPHSLHAPAHGA